jgi:hypothetical protein
MQRPSEQHLPSTILLCWTILLSGNGKGSLWHAKKSSVRGRRRSKIEVFLCVDPKSQQPDTPKEHSRARHFYPPSQTSQSSMLQENQR